MVERKNGINRSFFLRSIGGNALLLLRHVWILKSRQLLGLYDISYDIYNI